MTDETQEKPEEKNPLVEKILKEKKNFADKAKQLEDELKAMKEAKLKETENWKTMSEQKEKEANEWKTRFETQQNLIKKQVKETAVKKELVKMGLDVKYLDETAKLVDLESVNYDEETGVVMGADIQAKMVHEKFTPLFVKAPAGANHDAPKGTATSMTLDEFKSLPLKEMREKKVAFYESQGIVLNK